jgi:translation initiation factor 2 subunit 1
MGLINYSLAIHYSLAIENIIPPFVEIKGSLNLSINIENGVQVIKEALQAAEDFTSEKDEISVMCFYDGAPEYRIVLKAPDFKTAEDLWVEVSETIVEKMEESGGQATSFRD